MNSIAKKSLIASSSMALLALGYKMYNASSEKRRNNELQSKLMNLNQYLSEKQSVERKQIVFGYVDYKLTLVLAKGTSYSGLVDMSVELLSKDDLFIDFQGQALVEVKVNGKSMTDQQVDTLWNKYFLVVPKELLNKGQNQISILFKNTYCSDGEGLHSMTDTDEQQYLYTNLEPAYCRKWFPCLDQPNIKASLDLTTLLPEDWVAISNELVKEKGLSLDNTQINQLQDSQIPPKRLQSMNDLSGMRVWSFNKTQYISTYLMCVCAGPYKEIKAYETYKNIPMSLWCRESCFQDLQSQQHIYFETTNKCMAFYEEFFQQPFVFSKYDHVFCPQFNCGAMENPGAVTVNDSYIFKDKVAKGTRSHLVTMVAHELCHMWFGDFVTMDWWDGLWLNESFADFLSFYACEQFSLSFDQFDFASEFNDRKGWGYSTDMSNATHAIAGAVLDTRQAESIFDGITYSKGSATLKQMLFLLGPKRFSDALGIYFKKHGFGNTTLTDFINALESQFQGEFSLDQWKTDWLEVPGCNWISAEFKYDTNQIEIKQGSVITQFSHNRYHKINMALYKKNASEPSLIKEVMVKNQEVTLIDIENVSEYFGVLLNYDDYDFVKIKIDKYSMKQFGENLKAVGSTLNQKLVVRALFEQVKDGEATSQDLLQFIKQNQTDQADEILSSMMSFLGGAIYHYSPEKRHLDMHVQAYEVAKEQLLMSTPQRHQGKNPISQDRVTCLIDSLISFAHADYHVDELISWYEHESLGDIDFALSYYNKWAIVKLAIKSAHIPLDNKKALLANRLANDQTDKAQQEKVYCETVMAQSQEQLDILWSTFIDPKEEPLQIVTKKMNGFNNDRRDLTQYHQKFFDTLEYVYANQSFTQANHFFGCLFPISDDFPMLIANLQKLLKIVDENKQPTFYKKLNEKLDYVLRRQNCCKLFE